MSALKGLDKPPSREQRHMLADYVELRCLASFAGEFSAEEFEDTRKRKEADTDEPPQAGVAAGLLDDDPPLRPAALAAALGMEAADEPATPPTDPGSDTNADPGPAAADDQREVDAEDVLDHLRYRQRVFGGYYPFELSGPVLSLREQLTEEHRLYLVLLLSANLSYIRDKPRQETLTTYFEQLSPIVLRGLLGPVAEVHLFGTTTEEGGRYEGGLWEKVLQLRDDMRLELLAKAQEEIVDAEKTSGDNGLDVVAWFPVSDEATSLVTIWGQCACGAEWYKKFHEPSEQNWSSVFAFRFPVVNALLIPHCFRSTDGLWYEEVKVKRGVLVDRLRITDVVARLDGVLPVVGYPDGLVNEALDEEGRVSGGSTEALGSPPPAETTGHSTDEPPA